MGLGVLVPMVGVPVVTTLAYGVAAPQLTPRQRLALGAGLAAANVLLVHWLGAPETWHQSQGQRGVPAAPTSGLGAGQWRRY